MNPNNKRLVVYTAIVGKKDGLITPKYIPENCDFVCFTDQPFSSSVWDVRQIDPSEVDSTRSARKYKILPHKYLPEYEYSIWIDGNVLVQGDLNEMIEKYLSDANLAVIDHADCPLMPLSTLAEHEQRLLDMENQGKHQDDPEIFLAQGEAYRKDGFPDTGGQAWTLVLLRKHAAADVIEAMERWWEELSKWSKRDQMSFNYVAWKTNLHFNYIHLDGMDNPYTKRLNHYIPLMRKSRLYFLAGLKRLLHLDFKRDLVYSCPRF